MNGQREMDAATLYELLTTTSIEPFDPIEEAFKLLDVNQRGYLTISEEFKNIFSNLGFGDITPSDEAIFKEVADFDGDGFINLDDFKKICSFSKDSQNPEYADRMGVKSEEDEGEIDEGEYDMEGEFYFNPLAILKLSIAEVQH